MTDVRGTSKDMMRQRVVQAITAVAAIAGIILWVIGVPFSEYLAAAAIIVFTVATVRWVNDEEIIEEEKLGQVAMEKPVR